MNLKTYANLLNRKGNLGQTRKANSQLIINQTFTQDPTYKKVYILTSDGWKFVDAKYQFHQTPSISKDAVDYYLQFRPSVHFPIGSYVIIPDDTSSDINLTTEELKNPFKQPIKERTQWWLITGRDNANAFVRYSVLQCNWLFKWMYNGKIMSCYGCLRNANSYTSGIWSAEYTVTLDNITGAWIPDFHYIYGDKLEDLQIEDNRSIVYGKRYLISNNIYNPMVYQVSKVTDMYPQGIIKLTLKQDEFNSVIDNVDLGVCDYYSINGEPQTPDPSPLIEDKHLRSTITPMNVTDDGELEELDEIEPLVIGTPYYFKVEFSRTGIDPVWHINITDDVENKEYFEKLMKLTIYEDNTIMVKPSKAKSLIGKHFSLFVTDSNGDYYSSIDLEVTGNAT